MRFVKVGKQCKSITVVLYHHLLKTFYMQTLAISTSDFKRIFVCKIRVVLRLSVLQIDFWWIFSRGFEVPDNFSVQFMLWNVGFHWKQTRTVSDFDFPNFWKFASKTAYWRDRISLVFVKELKATERFEKKTRICFHILILWLYLIVKKAAHAVGKSWEAM